MKTIFSLAMTFIIFNSFGQSIQGTWQLTNSQTCFEANMNESDTERELESAMGKNSSTTVARLIVFKKDGSGQEGIFSVGNKKGSDMNSFQYKFNGAELNFTDKKSGMITHRFVVDELTETSLKIHDAEKDCETKSFIKVK